MNSWPDALIAETHLQPTKLCRVFEITPIGGATIYFTDADQPITVGGHTYKPNNSFMPSAISNAIGGANANFDLVCLLGDEGFSYLDCVRNLPAGALVFVALASWGNPSAGIGQMFKGTVASIAMASNLSATLSCSGGTGLMGKPLTEVYSPGCRADLGDSRCQVDLNSFSAVFTVSSAASADMMSFPTSVSMADGLYNLGSILWATGANAGQSQEVAFSTATGVIHMFYPPRFAIAPSDTGTIYQGCAKTLAACTSYGNVVNFRGEPYVPGPIAPSS